MRHKRATLEHPRQSRSYSQDPPLPSDRRRKRRSHTVKNYYNPSHKSEFPDHPPQRLRSRRQRSNYKILAVLASTLVLGILLDRLILSLLPTSCKAIAPQEKVAVLSSPARVNPPATPPVVALTLAIVIKESSAEFQALNPHSGALGLAQIMPANLSEWSEDVLGYSLKPEEFLNSPQLQLKIIYHKLSEYWQEAVADSSGDEELAVLKVASYWYSGNPNLYTSTVPQSYQDRNGQFHPYPSVAEYSNSVLKKYRQYKGEKIDRNAIASASDEALAVGEAKR